MRKSLFTSELKKSRVESDWRGKRKDSKFLTAIKTQSLKASKADDDLQAEIDNLDELFRWGDEFCDKLTERTEQLDSVTEAFDNLGSFLKEFYNYEQCTLTDAICEYADICENKIIEQNNQLKERIELEITTLENFQRNDMMQMVEVITDRQEKKRDFEHYQAKLSKLTQTLDKKTGSGKELSEGEMEKKTRNEEKFVSAQAAWEATKDSTIITLNDLFEARYGTLDYLLSSHAQNEIVWSENLKEPYQRAMESVKAARQSGSAIIQMKQEDGLVKSRTGFLGRTIKSKFFADIGPATGEPEFDTLLYKMDFIYIAIGELKEHLKKIMDGIVAFTEGGSDLAVRLKQYYLKPGPEHRDSAQYYADTWERFAKSFTENMITLGRQLYTDLSNYEQNMINPIYPASKTYHEKKKSFEHYQIKVDKLRKKGSGKLKSNLEKLNQSETDYKKVAEALISSMRRTCNSRFEFLDTTLHDFIHSTNSFFQTLGGSLTKLQPSLPQVDAPKSAVIVTNPPPQETKEIEIDEAPEVQEPPVNPGGPPPAPPTAKSRSLPPVPGKRSRVSMSDAAGLPANFANPPPRKPVSKSLPRKPKRDPNQVLSDENSRRKSMGLPRASRAQRRNSKAELPAFDDTPVPPAEVAEPPAPPPGVAPLSGPSAATLPPPQQPGAGELPPPSPKAPDQSMGGPPPPPVANPPPPAPPKPQTQPPAAVPPPQPTEPPKPPTQPTETKVDDAGSSVPNMNDFDALFGGDDDFDLYAD